MMKKISKSQRQIQTGFLKLINSQSDQVYILYLKFTWVNGEFSDSQIIQNFQNHLKESKLRSQEIIYLQEEELLYYRR
ncbi:unnamed protein product [Paramecium octaurelia]|uniref:Uncharacterized protein n=1 Tax=Paramecium octaurelia TaxID=43137 RepID=A0A8S1WRZ1_PAROT|nr:unnamed protein product [Paramecium octaurelia]